MDDEFLPGFGRPPALQVLDAGGVEALVLDVIRSGGGRLSRGADVFLATLCARTIADRLCSGGLAVVRLEDGAPVFDRAEAKCV